MTTERRDKSRTEKEAEAKIDAAKNKPKDHSELIEAYTLQKQAQKEKQNTENAAVIDSYRVEYDGAQLERIAIALPSIHEKSEAYVEKRKVSERLPEPNWLELYQARFVHIKSYFLNNWRLIEAIGIEFCSILFERTWKERHAICRRSKRTCARSCIACFSTAGLT